MKRDLSGEIKKEVGAFKMGNFRRYIRKAAGHMVMVSLVLQAAVMPVAADWGAASLLSSYDIRVETGGDRAVLAGKFSRVPMLPELPAISGAPVADEMTEEATHVTVKVDGQSYTVGLTAGDQEVMSPRFRASVGAGAEADIEGDRAREEGVLVRYKAESRIMELPGVTLRVESNGDVYILSADDALLTLTTAGKCVLAKRAERQRLRQFTLTAQSFHNEAAVSIQSFHGKIKHFVNDGDWRHCTRGAEIGQCQIDAFRITNRGAYESYGNTLFTSEGIITNLGKMRFLEMAAKQSIGVLRVTDGGMLINHGTYHSDSLTTSDGAIWGKPEGKMVFKDLALEMGKRHRLEGEVTIRRNVTMWESTLAPEALRQQKEKLLPAKFLEQLQAVEGTVTFNFLGDSGFGRTLADGFKSAGSLYFKTRETEASTGQLTLYNAIKAVKNIEALASGGIVIGAPEMEQMGKLMASGLVTLEGAAIDARWAQIYGLAGVRMHAQAGPVTMGYYHERPADLGKWLGVSRDMWGHEKRFYYNDLGESYISTNQDLSIKGANIYAKGVRTYSFGNTTLDFTGEADIACSHMLGNGALKLKGELAKIRRLQNLVIDTTAENHSQCGWMCPHGHSSYGMPIMSEKSLLLFLEDIHFFVKEAQVIASNVITAKTFNQHTANVIISSLIEQCRDEREYFRIRDWCPANDWLSKWQTPVGHYLPQVATKKGDFLEQCASPGWACFRIPYPSRCGDQHYHWHFYRREFFSTILSGQAYITSGEYTNLNGLVLSAQRALLKGRFGALTARHGGREIVAQQAMDIDLVEYLRHQARAGHSFLRMDEEGALQTILPMGGESTTQLGNLPLNIPLSIANKVGSKALLEARDPLGQVPLDLLFQWALADTAGQIYMGQLSGRSLFYQIIENSRTVAQQVGTPRLLMAAAEADADAQLVLKQREKTALVRLQECLQEKDVPLFYWQMAERETGEIERKLMLHVPEWTINPFQAPGDISVEEMGIEMEKDLDVSGVRIVARSGDVNMRAANVRRFTEVIEEGARQRFGPAPLIEAKEGSVTTAADVIEDRGSIVRAKGDIVEEAQEHLYMGTAERHDVATGHKWRREVHEHRPSEKTAGGTLRLTSGGETTFLAPVLAAPRAIFDLVRLPRFESVVNTVFEQSESGKGRKRCLHTGHRAEHLVPVYSIGHSQFMTQEDEGELYFRAPVIRQDTYLDLPPDAAVTFDVAWDSEYSHTQTTKRGSWRSSVNINGHQHERVREALFENGSRVIVEHPPAQLTVHGRADTLSDPDNPLYHRFVLAREGDERLWAEGPMARTYIPHADQHHSWHHRSSSLGSLVRPMVTIGVTAASMLLTGVPVSPWEAAGVAFQNSLVSEAICNGISHEQLLTGRSLRSACVAAGSAYATQSLQQVVGLAEKAAPGLAGMGHRLGQAGCSVVGNTVVSSGLTGQRFEDVFAANLRSGAVTAVGATLAGEMKALESDYFLHKVGHGVVGGFTGYLAGGDMLSGAIGGALGEVVAGGLHDRGMTEEMGVPLTQMVTMASAYALNPELDPTLLALTAGLAAENNTFAEKAVTVDEIFEELPRFKWEEEGSADVSVVSQAGEGLISFANGAYKRLASMEEVNGVLTPAWRGLARFWSDVSHRDLWLVEDQMVNGYMAIQAMGYVWDDVMTKGLKNGLHYGLGVPRRATNEIVDTLNAAFVVLPMAMWTKAKVLSSISKVPMMTEGITVSEVGSAKSALNGARLRTQLIAEEIVSGHAFEKHVLTQGEWAGWIRTRKQLMKHAEMVLESPKTEVYKFRDGRTLYAHRSSHTVLIRNTRGEGTIFQPRVSMDQYLKKSSKNGY